ncbi:MAG: HEAT repeat domain-containing protein, partial [Candidatus Thorarchaeota archaeon]
MTEIQGSEGIDIEYAGVHTNTINEIALSFQLRHFEKSCTQIDTLLQEQGWSKTVALLRKIPVEDDEYTGYWFWNRVDLLTLKEGIIRDGLLSILGLECVPGIDVDLLKTFGRFKAHSLHELREKVISKAIILLKVQIQRGNTYFIDTGQLIGTSFESLVPEVKKQRAQEFTSLGNKPSLSRALTTYYGFAELTNSLTAEDTMDLEQITTTPLEFSGKRVSYQRSIFSHCSEELTDLLLACLRLTFAQPQTQIKGANVLAELADSRSLGALHQVLQRESQSGWHADPMNPVKYRVIWALSEIGHPDSLSFLKALVKDRTFDQHAMWAIARNS